MYYPDTTKVEILESWSVFFTKRGFLLNCPKSKKE